MCSGTDTHTDRCIYIEDKFPLGREGCPAVSLILVRTPCRECPCFDLESLYEKRTGCQGGDILTPYKVPEICLSLGFYMKNVRRKWSSYEVVYYTSQWQENSESKERSLDYLHRFSSNLGFPCLLWPGNAKYWPLYCYYQRMSWLLNAWVLQSLGTTVGNVFRLRRLLPCVCLQVRHPAISAVRATA